MKKPFLTIAAALIGALFYMGDAAWGEPDDADYLPAPEGHVLSEIISGYYFRSPETQALQDDDFENPGFLWVEQGEELWANIDGSAGQACASCHEVHAAQDPVLDKLAQQEKCFSCHPRTRSETYRASSHPLRFGEMTCTDCHDPHNGSNDFLLIRSTINDTCYTCHAEKRGPYLWEHAPVTEDCSLCHNSHGSNHASLLVQRSPLLCQQCHSPGGHPATAYTSEAAENTFQQRFLLARSCENCHAQVHGSNHPSGVTITR